VNNQVIKINTKKSKRNKRIPKDHFISHNFFLKKNRKNKSIGALGLIRKCLTVLPSKRFTVDDIAAHWWINLGYKYPPVHYYLTPAMKKNGIFMSSDIPALTYTKPIPKTPELNSKISAPVYSTQNGQIKSKVITNGYHSKPRTHRLNSNTDSKTSRRTSRERYNEIISSKNPLRTQ